MAWVSDSVQRRSICRRCSKVTVSPVRPRRSFRCRSRLPCDKSRPEGALVVLVAVQLSVLGLYLPPVFKAAGHHIRPRRSFHCRSRLPCDRLGAAGALVVLVAVQLSVLGLYLPPVFKRAADHQSAPDDHFTAGPDCRVTSLGQRARWSCWWLSNYPCWDCISRRCSNSRCRHIRPRRSFHCRSRLPCDSLAQRARWWCWWLSNCRCWDCISRRCSKQVPSSLRPRRSFHCRSTLLCDRSGSGRVGGAGGCPTIGAGIVSAAGVQIACRRIHPRRSFHCRSRLPCDRFGQWARWSCWWLSNCRCWDCISRRCSNRLPHHLRPRRSFHCQSRLPCGGSGSGRIGECRWSPRIIGAATRGTSYYRKRVGNLP